MLKYHKKGVTLTLELHSVDDLEGLQDGLSDALLLLAEDPDGKTGHVLQTITRLLGATRLTSEQQQQVAAVLQGHRAAA